MKALHLYEVRLVDGTRYQGEIAYKDDKMIVLKLRQSSVEQKLRLFYNGIVSIHDIGWQRVYAFAS